MGGDGGPAVVVEGALVAARHQQIGLLLVGAADAIEAELARYRAVIVPTLSRIDHGLAQRLRALAEHKRAVVVVGDRKSTRLNSSH